MDGGQRGSGRQPSSPGPGGRLRAAPCGSSGTGGREEDWVACRCRRAGVAIWPTRGPTGSLGAPRDAPAIWASANDFGLLEPSPSVPISVGAFQVPEEVH